MIIRTHLLCSVCGEEFLFDDIMSSDAPMCEECAEKEWQELKKKDDLDEDFTLHEWIPGGLT